MISPVEANVDILIHITISNLDIFTVRLYTIHGFCLAILLKNQISHLTTDLNIPSSSCSNKHNILQHKAIYYPTVSQIVIGGLIHIKPDISKNGQAIYQGTIYVNLRIFCKRKLLSEWLRGITFIVESWFILITETAKQLLLSLH